MTLREKFEKCITWQDKVRYINLYHALMTFRKDKWNIRKTALYFGISIGLVSENLRLAEHMDHVKQCITRKEALVLSNEYIRTRKRTHKAKHRDGWGKSK